MRCAKCNVVLGVFGGRGRALQRAVMAVEIDDAGGVWLVCRGCGERRRYLRGIAIVKADA